MQRSTASRTLSAVPTGTVDLVITTLYSAHVPADGARDREHVAQIRRAVLVRGRADRDQLEQTVLDTLLGIGGEAQTSGLGSCA